MLLSAVHDDRCVQWRRRQKGAVEESDSTTSPANERLAALCGPSQRLVGSERAEPFVGEYGAALPADQTWPPVVGGSPPRRLLSSDLAAPAAGRAARLAAVLPTKRLHPQPADTREHAHQEHLEADSAGRFPTAHPSASNPCRDDGAGDQAGAHRDQDGDPRLVADDPGGEGEHSYVAEPDGGWPNRPEQEPSAGDRRAGQTGAAQGSPVASTSVNTSISRPYPASPCGAARHMSGAATPPRPRLRV